jgi:ubiquitin-activating enzyme E1
MIKRPPKGFEAVVKNHFLIKRDEILDDCNKWL